MPSYVAFLTGLSFEELTYEHPKQKMRRIILSHSLLFILGFSVLFTILGASATLIGQFLAAHRDTIRIVGGILVILFGLFISGVFSFGFFAAGEEIAPPRQTFGIPGFLLGWRDLRCWLDPLCRPDPLLHPALCQHGRGHALGDFTPGFLFFRVRASFFRLFFGPEFLPERLPESP